MLHTVCCHIDWLLEQKSHLVVAIDGNCAAGKTTLAAQLIEKYDCNLIPVDAFFLRPEQRTPERLAEVGGNVDYERFFAEVLQPLAAGKPFSYRPYDCQTGTLAAAISVTPKKLTIIEGSYSHHPYFGNPYDLKIFLTVSPEVQRQRILERPAFLHQRFFTQWIPMEKAYFAKFSIAEKSDLKFITD